jgi:hypothetical protein
MGHDHSRTPVHTESGPQVGLSSPLEEESSKAALAVEGTAKRTLDCEDRFEMPEKGETARQNRADRTFMHRISHLCPR